MRLTDIPAPRPIPIVVGDLGDGFCWLVLRVLERGHDDVTVTRMVSTRALDELLSHVLDSAIREARTIVGIRHGVWICHLLPERSPYDSGFTMLPPVAPRIRMQEHTHEVSPYVTNRWDVSPQDMTRQLDHRRWLYEDRGAR